MFSIEKKKGIFLIIATLIIFTIVIFIKQRQKESPPYSQSTLIKSVEFDWDSHIRLAPGSDNWPITWADDNKQYSAWGDGGGFNGTNNDGRVSLGVAQIDGEKNNYKGINILGGKNALQPATIKGKSYGIISVDKSLYMWVSPDDGVTCYFDLKIYRSNDHGANWQPSKWHIPKETNLITPTFLQFGMDYQDSRDNLVYIYSINKKKGDKLAVHKPGEICLIRVPKTALMDINQFDFFEGVDSEGKPVWGKNIEKRQPVFKDSNGVGWNCSVSYNKFLKRYLLITEHEKTKKGNIGIFEAAEPWGPWKTVLYDNSFGKNAIQRTTFFWNFSNKWLSNDGKRFVFIFTGIKKNDSWNTVNGKFRLFYK